MALTTELKTANKFEAINTLAIPVATYSCNIQLQHNQLETEQYKKSGC